MKKNAFTLIELLVVIAIIAILAVIILAALNQARKSARDAKRKEAVRNAMTAIETYNSVEGNYPAVWADLDPDYLTQIPDEIDQAKSDLTASGYCLISTEFEAKTGNWFYSSGGIAEETPVGTVCD